MSESILYLVATPIGNLGDLSPRARDILSSVDFIAAEDTRVTQKLLTACALPRKPLISYYEHNRRARGEEVLARLRAGESCALVTDAGTPAVSDPGEGSGRTVRGAWHTGRAHPRLLRRGLRARGLRPADRTLVFRGLFIRE